MIFDTHAHYDDEQFDTEREELLAAMPAAGVGLIIDPGCDELSSRRAVELAERFPHVFAAVGWHPENCAPFTPEDIDALRELAKHPKVVAIGEIGLDYYWAENPPREFQQEVFRLQLALAEELELPVIVHDRDAHADSLEIVREFPNVRGVFHCFSGSVEMARELWKLGWYVGFDGPLTYKNAKKTVEVAAEAPAERILIETDAPYLAPVPLRGTRNDSRNLTHVAARLAEIRGTTPEAIMELTAENGKRLFRIA
ncbi:MAG: TatD family hydrolase [Oscillospiraceae bacterium]|nr:TatD family hydrolase [Oscillospiraceae bacterium]